jgi:hypothetical protein
MATESTCLTDSAISGPIPSPGKRVALIGSLGEVDDEKNDCAKGAKHRFVRLPAPFTLRSFRSAMVLIQIYYPETNLLTSGDDRDLTQRESLGSSHCYCDRKVRLLHTGSRNALLFRQEIKDEMWTFYSRCARRRNIPVGLEENNLLVKFYSKSSGLIFTYELAFQKELRKDMLLGCSANIHRSNISIISCLQCALIIA